MMIHRALALIAALWFGVQPAAAGWLLNSYIVTPPTPATITFLQCATDVSNLTTYTFSAQNTGTASGTRYTLVGVIAEDTASVFSVSTVTVGGDGASLIIDEGGTRAQSVAFYGLTNSSGTSEDIVVEFSEEITSAAVCLWQVNNLNSTTATATITANSGSGATLTLDLNVSADGIAAGVCEYSGASLSYTWTGLTERFDDGVAGEATRSAADYDEDSTASSPLAVTCVQASGTNTSVGAAVSFR